MTVHKPLFKNVMNKIDNELHTNYIKLLIKHKLRLLVKCYKLSIKYNFLSVIIQKKIKKSNKIIEKIEN